jgi:hypothetical protein
MGCVFLNFLFATCPLLSFKLFNSIEKETGHQVYGNSGAGDRRVDSGGDDDNNIGNGSDRSVDSGSRESPIDI